MCAVWGHELTGRDVLCELDSVERSLVLKVLRLVIETGSIGVIGLSGGMNSGVTMEMEMLLLPITIPGENPAIKVLGVIQGDLDAGWYSSERLQRLALRSLSPVLAVQNDLDGEPPSVARRRFRVIAGGLK